MNGTRLFAILSAVLLLNIQTAEAEPESPFVFQETSIDFGNIREADGVVSGTFYFRNRSDRPVQIDAVATSCGCTTVDYPTRPIAPGESCELEVRLNPANMAGKIYRDVTVVTRTSEDRLVIHADVEPTPVGPEKTYPAVIGDGIRSRDLAYRFGYAAQGRSQSQSITLYNGSDRTVRLEASSSNPYLKVQCPYSLKPGTADGMSVTYEIPVSGQNYGICEDIITIYVDGTRAPQTISLTAIMVDDLDRNDSAAPSMRITPTYFTLDGVKQGKTEKRQCTIYNDGKKDLAIRYVKTSDNVTTSLKAGTVIKPGGSAKVELKATAGSGRTSEGGVYIIFLIE